MQLPLITPPSDWRPPSVADLPSWGLAKRVAIDIETCDPKLRELGPGVRRGAYIVGISFAIEDGPKHYLPLRHSGGDNMEDPQQALEWFRQQAKEFQGEIVGANLGYDLDFLLHVGIDFPQVKRFRDVQVAEFLIDELQFSYSLETICNKYLGVGKNESLLREAANAYGVNPKSGMYLLPARYVGAYAEADANLPLLALRRQEKEIEEQELWNIYNVESDLLPALVRMRRRGVRVDLDKLAKVEQWSTEQERKALTEVRYLTGHDIPFNSVWQSSVLVRPLESIGCKIPLTPKTKKPSIDRNFLNGIEHPVAKAINRARRVNKIRTTFAQSIRNHIIGDRIHCTYNQGRSSDDADEEGEGRGARFGRLSAQNPNMQQQPARDPEIGPLWRDIYIPENSELWFSADFSSQEPRQVVHYANITKLENIKIRDEKGSAFWMDANQSAKAMAERYRNDSTTDPHGELARTIYGQEPNKQERDASKTIFLGISYGMGGPKLCRSLGFSTIMAVYDPITRETVNADSEEGRAIVQRGGKIFEAAGADGQALMDKFDNAAPFVRALNKICTKAANKYGYIRTAAGRKCRFEKDEQGNLIGGHKSLNRLIQGSAADQTKICVLALDKEGFFITGQVHDEVFGSIKNHAEAKKIAEIMTNAYSMSIPSRVDVDIGKSWGDAH